MTFIDFDGKKLAADAIEYVCIVGEPGGAHVVMVTTRGGRVLRESVANMDAAEARVTQLTTPAAPAIP